MPDGRIMPGYYILRFPDWVNVVPVTSDGQVVLIRQYRHATGEVHWEVPGGAIHRDEDPCVAAMRELREETGYASSRVEKVVENYPNPALQDNRIHTYVALDCRLEGPQDLDPYEDIEVVVVSLGELRRRLTEGEFSHNIMVSSLYQTLTYLEAKNLI